MDLQAALRLAGIDPARVADIDLRLLTRLEREEMINILERQEKRKAQRLFYEIFPDEDTIWDGASGILERGATIYARSKYPKHLEFFKAGAEYPERAAMCANRIGKTFAMGGYETACHLTGLYPTWWVGRRFSGPVNWWAAGDTNETTRDIIQSCLFGEIDAVPGRKVPTGTGIIPGHLIGRWTWKSGVEGLIDQSWIRHVTGGWSRLGLKSYEQGRKAFQGTAKHGCWLDEEPPAEVYDECRVRTMTTNGLILMTFTPLSGLTDVALAFMPDSMRPGGAQMNKVNQVDLDFAGVIDEAIAA